MEKIDSKKYRRVCYLAGCTVPATEQAYIGVCLTHESEPAVPRAAVLRGVSPAVRRVAPS